MEELERELSQIQARMGRELDELNAAIGGRLRAPDDAPPGAPDPAGNAALAGLLQQKPPDFDGMLSKLQENRRQVQALESELAQQQREIELLLREDRRGFALAAAPQAAPAGDAAPLALLDDLARRIGAELEAPE